MALLGLGTPAAAAAQCKQYVVQIPCEAEAGLHKLRTKLEGSTVRGLAQPLDQALDDLQACTHEQMQYHMHEPCICLTRHAVIANITELIRTIVILRKLTLGACNMHIQDKS